jgi:FKBP-type peptidyl-prolyl cis-trans isomerase
LKVNQNQQSASNTILDPSEFTTYNSYQTSDRMLQQDIKVGAGASVVTGKKVAVLYKGWLTDGTVFDQTKTNEQNEPQPFVFTPVQVK